MSNLIFESDFSKEMIILVLILLHKREEPLKKENCRPITKVYNYTTLNSLKKRENKKAENIFVCLWTSQKNID